MVKKFFLLGSLVLLLLVVSCPGSNDVSPKLTKITIGSKTLAGVEIKETMDFGITSETKLKVSVETTVSNASVNYSPLLKDGFWELEEDKENELEISVALPASKAKMVYKVKITHKDGTVVNESIINSIVIEGLQIDGELQEIAPIGYGKSILEGDDVVVEIEGPQCSITIGYTPPFDPDASTTPPPKPALKSVKINSQDMQKGNDSPAYDYWYFYNVDLAQGEIFDVKIEAEADGGDKTWINFKIQRGNGQVDIPNVYLYMEEDVLLEDSSGVFYFIKPTSPSDYLQFDGDNPTKIKVGVLDQDVLSSISVQGTAETLKQENLQGKTFYYTEKSVNVDSSGSDIEITLTPKDEATYKTMVLRFKINYLPPNKNAKFVFVEGTSEPLVDEEIEHKNEREGRSSDHPGATKVKTISFYTPVATTKVFYKKILLLWDKDAQGGIKILEEKDLGTPQQLSYTHDANASKNMRHKHTASNIQLDEDKPTILRFYTEAKDGSKDRDLGEIDMPYNLIKLRWDYADRNKSGDFKNLAWDEIKISKTSLAAGNKIHVTFRIFDEERVGFKVDNSSLPQYQTPFTVLEKNEASSRVWVKSEVDVSTLLQASNPATELEIKLPILEQTKLDKDGKPTGEFLPCFTYKVKVKLES